MGKEFLFGKTFDEIKTITKELGMPGFAAKQIIDWLYKKEVSSIDDFSNLSKAFRDKLKENFELGIVPPVKVQESADGTKKYLFAAHGHNFIETAMIPDEDRKTVCVSSQVGCKMGCLFCMTARQGFQANLTVTEILNQYRSLPEFKEITNLVYMGMGEPMDNLEEVLKSLEILTAEWGYALSPKRITVSTIGVIPAMREFLNRSKCHLAISIHNPFDEQRSKLMPIQQAYPIKEVVAVLRHFDFGLQRRLSFEYIMFEGINDTPKHVAELARLLNGLRCRINLIRFHPITDSPLKSSNDETIQLFKDALNAKEILTTIRASRGLDILAACGLLSTKELVANKENKNED